MRTRKYIFPGFFCFWIFLLSGLLTPAFAQQANAEEEAIELIEMMFEMFPAEQQQSVLMRDGKRVYTEVRGIRNSYKAHDVAMGLERALVSRNTEALFALIKENGLSIDLEATNDDTLAFVSVVPETAEDRLNRAVASSSLEAVEKIIQTESPDLDKEVLRANAVFPFTPIYVAASNADTDMVKLLLSHGASPNKLTEKGAPPPIGFPILANDIELTRVFLDAGASLDIRVGLADRNPPAVVASQLNSMELLELFVEYDADLSSSGINGWTALSDSLSRGQFDMAKFLIDHSNPLKSTYPEVTKNGGRDFGYPWFPGGNALFHARHFGGEQTSRLAALIVSRTETLGGKPARLYLEMSSLVSEADLAYVSDDAAYALQLMEEAAIVYDMRDVRPKPIKSLFIQGMKVLGGIHELKLINGEQFDETYRQEAQRHSDMGGKYKNWHDMLDILTLSVEGRSGDVDGMLRQWESVHGKPVFKIWQLKRLRNWIDNSFEPDQRSRLNATLDFFEKK